MKGEEGERGREEEGRRCECMRFVHFFMFPFLLCTGEVSRWCDVM